MAKLIDKNKIKTWFITGASSGIGLEVCKQCLGKGYNVIAVARNKPDIEHPNALCLSADVTKPETITDAFRCGLEKFKEINVLFNSAGISSYGTFEEEPAEEMRKVMEVNFWGTYNTMHRLLPYFRSKQTGTIVNISSEMGLYPRAYGAAYCASKYALEGLTSVVWWETKKFCRILTVELDKFDGTKIGANKPKGVSNIPEYKGLQWLPYKILNFNSNKNDLTIAVSFIIKEVEKKKITRRLMLGKTICQRTYKEINSIKKDINYSYFKALKCANINIFKLMSEYIIRNFKKK